MNTFDKYCNKVENSIKSSGNKMTRDVAMCQIFTGLTYSILALACAVRDKCDENTKKYVMGLEKENKKLRKIANKALDDKNRLLDERLEKLGAVGSLED